MPVGHPDFGRAIPCQCKEEQIALARLEDLRRAGNLHLLSHMTFETFIPDGYGLNEEKRRNLRAAYQATLEFAREPNGWLILKGGYGCGKTHLAAAIANDRVARGHPVVFAIVPDLLDHLRAAFNPASGVTYDDRFERVRTASLLILDDLGTQSSTSWAQEKLYQIFNYRYNAQLPTVITTNHDLEDTDIRLRSRMADPSLCRICTILAPDFRASGVDRGTADLSSLALHSDKTFDSFDLRVDELDLDEVQSLRDAVAAAQAFAYDPQGWLVFTGDYGCGKTHLAAAIANHRTNLGYPALFVTVPDLLDHLRATFNPQSLVTYDKRFEQVREADFLILDDLGVQSPTPWVREKLHQLFDYRYNARLPTIITTTQTLEEMDPRLKSRLLDKSRCLIVPIIAPAYRGASRPTTSKRRRRGVRD